MLYLVLFVIAFFTPNITCPMHQKDRITGAILGGALGDGLGGFTEYNFTMSDQVQAVRMGHAGGLLRTYQDLLAEEKTAKDLDTRFPNQEVIPYTDDTAMALIVMKVLIQARQHNWSDDQIMTQLATEFIHDMDNNLHGWASDARSPGGACKTAVKKLKSCNRNTPQWWRVGAHDAGGNGSVMRVYPFGLVFADDIERAERLAVEHSRLTHQHPMALAACAAMTVGTAHTIQGKQVSEIVQHMENAARKYDATTADYIRAAYNLAQQRLDTLTQLGGIYSALSNEQFRTLHNKTFPQNDESPTQFAGWTAQSAISAATYILTLSPDDPNAAICLGVHTLGDSDSIASMAGTLVGGRCGVAQLDQNSLQKIENVTALRKHAQDIKGINIIHPPSSSPINFIFTGYKWPLFICCATLFAYGCYIWSKDDQSEEDKDTYEQQIRNI